MYNVLYVKKIKANELLALKVAIFLISYFNPKKRWLKVV
jgi:hypothetical protein